MEGLLRGEWKVLSLFVILMKLLLLLPYSLDPSFEDRAGDLVPVSSYSSSDATNESKSLPAC